MSDKGKCEECGRVSFLMDCEQEEHQYDDGCLEVDYECPYCEEGYINEFISSTPTEFIAHQINHEVALIKLKLYRKFYPVRRWLDDALHPSRQNEFRTRMHDEIKRNANLAQQNVDKHFYIKELEENAKPKILDAVEIFAKCIECKLETFVDHGYSSINYTASDQIESQDIDKNHVAITSRRLVAIVNVPQLHELQRMKVINEESKYMWTKCIASQIAFTIAQKVMHELFDVEVV